MSHLSVPGQPQGHDAVAVTIPVDELLDRLATVSIIASPPFMAMLQASVKAAPGAVAEAIGRAGMTPKIRALLLRALGATGCVEVVPAVVAWTNAKDADVRAAAIATLGLLRDPAAREAVRHGSTDLDGGVRIAAAEAELRQGWRRAPGPDRRDG